mgnify:FL=1
MAKDKATQLDHPELNTVMSDLKALRELETTVKENKDEKNARAKELLADSGKGKFEVPADGGVLGFTVSESQGQARISGELLLEAGVSPAIIERCTKKSPYTMIGPIKFISGPA